MGLSEMNGDRVNGPRHSGQGLVAFAVGILKGFGPGVAFAFHPEGHAHEDVSDNFPSSLPFLHCRRLSPTLPCFSECLPSRHSRLPRLPRVHSRVQMKFSIRVFTDSAETAHFDWLRGRKSFVDATEIVTIGMLDTIFHVGVEGLLNGSE